jgi:hypothetical protein
MGWLYGWQTDKKEFRKEMVKSAEWDGPNSTSVVKLDRLVGNNLWLAVESTTKATGESATWVLLCKMQQDQGRWGYKDIAEDMGPVEVNCPISILDACDPPKGDYAPSWRKRVIAYHEKQKALRRAKYASGRARQGRL